MCDPIPDQIVTMLPEDDSVIGRGQVERQHGALDAPEPHPQVTRYGRNLGGWHSGTSRERPLCLRLSGVLRGEYSVTGRPPVGSRNGLRDTAKLRLEGILTHVLRIRDRLSVTIRFEDRDHVVLLPVCPRITVADDVIESEVRQWLGITIARRIAHDVSPPGRSSQPARAGVGKADSATTGPLHRRARLIALPHNQSGD